MFYHLSHWPVWNSGFSGDSWLVWKHTKLAFRHVPPTAKVTASWVRPTSCTSLKTKLKGWLYLKILEKVGWPKRKSENLSGAINFFLCFQVWGIHNTTTCKLGFVGLCRALELVTQGVMSACGIHGKHNKSVPTGIIQIQAQWRSAWYSWIMAHESKRIPMKHYTWDITNQWRIRKRKQTSRTTIPRVKYWFVQRVTHWNQYEWFRQTPLGLTNRDVLWEFREINQTIDTTGNW